MTQREKEYIGDGVYVLLESYSGESIDLVLTTENGISITNRIVLEPAVLRNLLDYIERHKRPEGEA